MLVQVEGGDAIAEAPEEASKKEAPKTGTEKVAAARAYLKKHGIEVRLAEAMQALLKEKPDNAMGYLISQLQAGGDERPPTAMGSPGEAPADEEAKQAPPADMAELADERLAKYVEAVAQLQGVRSPAVMSEDERCEVERVLSKVLLELTGELAGEYYPLPLSRSFPAKPGGMSARDAQVLAESHLLFEACAASGRGVFVTNARDAAVWINEGDQHVRLIVLKADSGAMTKLALLQSSVAAALGQDGHELHVRPRGMEVVRRLQYFHTAVGTTGDELLEVERVLSKALLELTGELSGEYYPLRSSMSFQARPGGMSFEEENAFSLKALAFTAEPHNSAGKGIFMNLAGSAVACVNQKDHVRFVVLKEGEEGKDMLARFEGAVAAALVQEGYALV